MLLIFKELNTNLWFLALTEGKIDLHDTFVL